jgi:hypothetical protein
MTTLTKDEMVFLDRAALHFMTLPMTEEGMQSAFEEVLKDDKRIFDSIFKSSDLKQIKSILAFDVYQSIKPI